MDSVRKRSTGLWALGAGSVIALGLLLRHTMAAYSFGRKNTLKLNRDPNMLSPAFANRLELLFKNLRMLGWDPCLNEGYRSPERAAQLAADYAAGKGPKAAKDSLHIYGVAADIISCTQGWSNPAFFKALGEEAKKLGLTWGGDFGDPDHVQAVPATNVAQNEVRNAVNVDAVVRKYLA